MPMTSLTGPSRSAVSGKADSLVVFLHGYGADGNDLIGLAEPLAPHLPRTSTRSRRRKASAPAAPFSSASARGR
jgi:predicted esterase